MSSSEGRRRNTDLRKLMMSDHKVELIDDISQEIFVEFNGPSNSLYEGGKWTIRVELPDDYPTKPPSIHFMNKIYHPNIDEPSGSVCLNVINEDWQPVYDLNQVFDLFLPQLLLDPNPSDPFNYDAADLMLIDNPTYEQRVREYCERYAKPNIEPAPEEKSSEEEPREASGDEAVEALVQSLEGQSIE